MLRALSITLLFTTSVMAQTITFEEMTFPGSSLYVNNVSFTSAGASFPNTYFPPGGGFGEYWTGFAYSKVKDVVTPGVNAMGQIVNGHAAFYKPLDTPPDPPGFGAGAGGSTNYAVAYDGGAFTELPVITLPANTRPLSLAVTNTTYTAISMRDGDSFAKKFGGPTGNDPDFFKLIVRGLDAANAPTGNLEFFLADYQGSSDYIVSAWTTLDLSGFGANTRKLAFSFDSSDFTTDINGAFLYYNTPLYVAVDNLTLAPVPEPMGLGLIAVLAAISRRRLLN